MEQGLSGGTTNLLRMARSGCQSGSSFVALPLTDDSFATAVYPATPEPGAVDVPTVDAVVRQLWHDPGLGRGKALVRTVRIGEVRLAVAAVPLAMSEQGQPSGILGVADPSGKSFGLPDLELLSRIAQRLTSYVRARRAVRSQLAHASTGVPEGSEASGGQVGADRPVLSSPMWLGGAHSEGAEASETDARAGGSRGGAAVGGFPPPPFPPPAGTAGLGPIGAPGTAARTGAVPAPTAAPTVAVRSTSSATASAGTPNDDSVRTLLGTDGEIEGLVPLGALLGRAGRLLGAGTAMSGALTVVAVEVEGVTDPSAEDVARVARAIRTELRFDDPLARIGDLSFVAVVPLAPGASTAAQVEAHLSARVRSAVAPHPAARVHAAHVVAPLNGGQDADELLRAAVVKLHAR